MSLSVDSERRPRPGALPVRPVPVTVAAARGHWQPASEVSPPAGAWAQLLSLSCCCYASRRHTRRRRGQAGLPFSKLLNGTGPPGVATSSLSV